MYTVRYVFDAGFRREKISSSEENISYICSSCKSKSGEINCHFIFVGSLGFGFTCIQCGEKIDNGFKTEKCNSSDTPSHRCNVCGETFQRPHQLLYHSYDHSNEWPYRCSVCQNGFATRNEFERHKKTLEAVRKIQCVKCLKIFRGKICYKVAYTSTTPLYCEKCASGPNPVKYVTT
ncbi:hypothetical protein TNIN_200211 [Trichonephila inaurata madagascariensis]|uniref:C2H2-type domain-containing protein n=1 Tax=Trichonephila inaurata madagascariensis TaxID=2747483 RepID=A0A8X6ITS4_9ARAC|nr:hypothetical protein TNIN_200211 [Trichonephila inaurata madagascariensis]